MKSAPTLLVTHGFPPYIPTLGGAMRILKLAEYLRATGTITHVLAARGRDFGDFGYGDLLRSLQLHYVADPLHRRGSGVSPAGGSPEPGARSARLATRIVSALKPAVLECSVPDTGIATVPALYRRARALIAEHAIRNVLTSGPPHSTHLAGWLLKRRFGDRLNWIVDYRDSWNGTSLFRKSNRALQALNLRAERAVLDRLDHFVYVSPAMLTKAQGFASDRLRLQSRARLVMNGFDDAILANRRAWVPTEGHLRIGYFGALDDGPSSYRNPARLFEAIESHDLPVRIELWGAIAIGKQWQDRLGDRLAICGNLPHDRAFAKMCEYDALLLLHTRDDGAEEVITGKLFEYLASGRPVLSIGPRVMAANAILGTETCNVICDHGDPAVIAVALRELLERRRRGTLRERDTSEVHHYSRSHQYALLQTLFA